MTRAPRAGRRRPARRSLDFRPRLEALEARWVPSGSGFGALRQLPGFDQFQVARSDDGNSGLVPIGFTLNFFGREYDHLFVHVNGSVTFDLPAPYYQPGPLKDITSPIIAPYLADVDTRPDEGGTVTYARGTLDGHQVFAVTWDKVGYYPLQTDKHNSFQLLLIDRADVSPGSFDMELNYGTIEWSGAGFIPGDAKSDVTPRVGFTAGTGFPGTYFELPGGGLHGSFLDGQPLALVAADVTGAMPGRRVFLARDGEVTNVGDPVVQLTTTSAISPAGTEWVAAGQFTAPGDGPWTVEVDYGDGSPPEQFIAAPDGTFVLDHVFAAQSTYQVTVTVADPFGSTGRASTRVFVLPGGSAGKILASTFEVAGPGETVWPSLSVTDFSEVSARYTRSEGAAGEASVFLALYNGAPVKTDLKGLFLDLQVGGAAPGDEISLTITDPLLKGAFRFGYFDHQTDQWVSLLDRPELCEVTVDPLTGTMTVHFKKTDIFDGTVFTVSLPPSSGVQSTGTVQGPTASAGDTSGLSRSVTFTNTSELAVALTSSRSSQLAVSAADQGSQGGTSGAAGPGGGKLPAQDATSSASDAGEGAREKRSGGRARKAWVEDEALWQIIGGDEALMRLWVQGVDLTPLLSAPPAPGGDGPGGEEELEEEELEVAAPAMAEVVPVAGPLDAPAVFEGLSLPAPAAEADEPRLALAAAAVAGLAAVRRDGRRRRTLLACR